MRKSTILYLTSIFFIVSSCAVNPIEKDLNLVEFNKSKIVGSYFSNNSIDYVYKTNISLYSNELSGILIIKKINNSTHRVVFTTEFGNKLFDFEISESDFKINSIVDELNRTIVINTLKNDFKFLLKSDFNFSEKFSNSEFIVFKTKEQSNYIYAFFSHNENKLTKIVNTSKRKVKFMIEYTSKNNIFADEIVLTHKNINLKIVLNYLNQ
jgi:hypothetical protein